MIVKSNDLDLILGLEKRYIKCIGPTITTDVASLAEPLLDNFWCLMKVQKWFKTSSDSLVYLETSNSKLSFLVKGIISSLRAA